MFSPTESHVGPERAVHGLGQPIYRWWTPASKSLASTYPGPVVAGGNTGCWSPLSCNWLFTESLVCQLLCSALDSASQEPGREGLFSFCKQGQWAGEVCSTRSRLVGAELRCKPGPSGPSLSQPLPLMPFSTPFHGCTYYSLSLATSPPPPLFFFLFV